MRGRTTTEDLAPLNPKIEATLQEKEESKKYKEAVKPHLFPLHKATFKWKRNMHDTWH